jgi:isorenieratene synthase
LYESAQENDLFPVVIVGGGLAGLVAAAHLAERGLTPLVLEADTDWPGGRLCGGEPDVFEYNGQVWSFPSEHGVHALWGNYDNMRATLSRFLDIQLRPSRGEEWINRWGPQVRAIEAGTAVSRTWLPAPFHYLQLLLRPRFWGAINLLDFLSVPGFLLSLIWTLGLDPIKEQVTLDGLMMDEYFRGWTPNLRATFTGLGKNLLAAPPEEISLTAFIAALRFYTMLRRDSWWLDYLPANPHTCLIHPLVNAIEQRGGKVWCGARARRLTRLANGWRLQVEDARLGGMRSLAARQVILALDPAAAKELLTESPDTAPQANALRFPPVTSNVTVRLWFDVEPRPGAPGGMFTGDFDLDNFFWMHRLHEEFFAWHTQTGGSAFEAHLYGNDAALHPSDQALLALALNEAQRAFPQVRGHFVHGVVRRNAFSQTLFVVPTADSLHVETPWPNLLACGDWVGYPTPALWMERCCVTAIAAANQVLQANGCEPFPLIPPRRPELVARLLGGAVYWLRRLVGPGIMAAARVAFGRRRKRA